jgi:hypothetical protein
MKKIIGMAAMLFISAIAFAQKGYTDHSGKDPGTYNPADSKLASGRQGMNDRENMDGKTGMHDQHDMQSPSPMRHSGMGYRTNKRWHHYTKKRRYTHHYSK